MIFVKFYVYNSDTIGGELYFRTGKRASQNPCYERREEALVTGTLAASPTLSLTTFAFLCYMPATVAFCLFLQNMLTPFLPQKLCICCSFHFNLIFPGLAPSQHSGLNSTIPSSKRPPLTVLGDSFTQRLRARVGIPPCHHWPFHFG